MSISPSIIGLANLVDNIFCLKMIYDTKKGTCPPINCLRATFGVSFSLPYGSPTLWRWAGTRQRHPSPQMGPPVTQSTTPRGPRDHTPSLAPRSPLRLRNHASTRLCWRERGLQNSRRYFRSFIVSLIVAFSRIVNSGHKLGIVNASFMTWGSSQNWRKTLARAGNIKLGSIVGGYEALDSGRVGSSWASHLNVGRSGMLISYLHSGVWWLANERLPSGQEERASLISIPWDLSTEIA